MTSNSSQNISSCSTGGSDAAVGGNWLGFSLSPHMTAATMDGAADCSSGFSVQQHHGGGGLCYPPVVRTSPAPFGYALGGGQDGLANGGGGFYPGGLSSMPLNSDGSLCIVEALHRSEQERHGVAVSSSSSPVLEDFLGASTAMALSLDSSSFYYGGGHGHHAHGHDQGVGNLQPLQYITGSGGHDVYGGHSQLVDAQSAVAMAARWFAARGGGDGGYDLNGASAGVTVPMQGHPHPLALSMSSGTGSHSQSSSITMQVGAHTDSAVTEYIAMDGNGSKKRAGGGGGEKQVVVHRKSIDTFGQRTSQYRGVTRHRWTGRYEAHLWDNTCRKEGQTRKGRQVYLGGYDMEEKAARAYDLAALKYWGPSTYVNFPIEDYSEELEVMKNMTRQEYVAHLRRKSSGFSRGASIYRGVTRHHQHGRWQARIGRVSGNKDLYLGTFSTQEEAAEAYDVAAIKFRGLNAVTNFEISRYDVAKIMESNTLLPYEQVRRNKDGDTAALVVPEAAAAAMVQAAAAGGSCVADTWKIQAAAPLPAATVERGGGGHQQHQHQHQDLLSSEGLSLLHNVVSVDAAGTGGGMSNASSLAPSVSNSREQSPDRASGSLAMFFAKPAASVPTSRLAYPLPLGSWVSPSTVVSSARPGVSFAHLPMFAAWTDA